MTVAAARLLQAGNAAAAAENLERVVERHPNHAEALHLLGIATYRRGDKESGLARLARSLALAGERADFHHNHGQILRAEGRLDEAAASYRRALELDPAYARIHGSLGDVLGALGQPGEAVASFRHALEADSDDMAARTGLGRVLKDLGQLDEAIACFRSVAAARPDDAAVHSNLGNALRTAGYLDEAADCYHRALALDPGFAEGHNNLGILHRTRGEFEAAADCFRKAIEINPRLHEAHYNFGTAAVELGNSDEAAEAYRTALGLCPEFVKAYNGLGCLLLAGNRFEEAAAVLHRAVDAGPDYALAFDSLAIAQLNLGNHAEAAVCFRRAMDLEPEQAGSHSNLLFSLCHDPNATAYDILAEARRWGERHAAPLAARARPHANDPDPERRLRVGYVSPDFRDHAVDYFLEPLLAHHDREAVEIFCYAEVALPDARTDRYRELADHWRSTVGLRNEQVAERIREDRIDILVDLAGHTANNRLLAFAERPAPVQVSHLVGLGQTTGMAAMDYVLGDRQLIPDGHGERFAEAPWRLPRCFVSFQPLPGWPDISQSPARECGHATFAAFCNPSRITPPILVAWSRTLEAVPGARLLLKHQHLADPGVRQRLHAGFAAHGVAGRVDFEELPHGWGAEMGVYERVDIALNSFPMTGTTTSCIALWMGLPVVTLASDEAHDRFGACIMNAIGLDDGIASSVDDFVQRAAALAGDPGRLASLRAGLRGRMRASPLLDHEGCARAVEEAYRGMWRKWCAARGNF